jgi:hypothetical protein
MRMTHSANEAFEIAFSKGILTTGGLLVPAQKLLLKGTLSF